MSYYRQPHRAPAVEIDEQDIGWYLATLDGMIADLAVLYDKLPNDFQKEQCDKVGASIQYLKKKVQWKRKASSSSSDWRRVDL